MKKWQILDIEILIKLEISSFLGPDRDILVYLYCLELRILYFKIFIHSNAINFSLQDR